VTAEREKRKEPSEEIKGHKSLELASTGTDYSSQREFLMWIK